MIEIALLVDHPETIPTLVQWFQAQWPVYYAERTATEIAQDFYGEAHRVALPVRLVAFADDELAGTITLREHAIQTMPQFRPGLGGLLVAAQHRGCGIGTALVRAVMNLAQEQDYAKVYATTVTARGILTRLGWELVQIVSHGEEQLELYSCELERSAQPHINPDSAAPRGE